ncbi:methylated-DNA--[protein]-cysteine S-methyltransferase [Halocalculus aciditolerans]|uniref:Methylated-DNA-[protein]-cysteine S-methyltransferase DNA binding domain-containing protein n=1 Tax=Halocalculus aciditolerans TaxID=1383812 RepID=A0A830EZJ1_9EURY|nr:methylated-DNA--[protein]-cysteine S-methyltransferase [Halocalculus aciditolerans]GGL47770.1 hypothetical protein GCM10009039_02490 [Halocalculus aciditolerans]
MEFDAFGYPLSLDESRVEESGRDVRSEVRAYLDGEREVFDLTVDYPEGFVGDVMRVMTSIPYGETMTYGEVAAELDSAAVAVGQACGKNPVPPVVPCHRVVAADGLGGYSGEGGVELKRRLLELEGAGRVPQRKL